MWPDDLTRALRTRRFWTDYLFVTDPDDSEAPTWLLEFDLATSHVLSLDIASGISSTSLQVKAPASDPVELGWDDQAHWHPHVLRWPELEAITLRLRERCGVEHAGHALLLLYRFAPITSSDDAAVALPTLEEAWGRLSLFSAGEIAEFVERSDYRAAGVAWTYDESRGWTIHQHEPVPDGQPDAYSTRVPGGPFPTPLWQRFLRELGLGGRV